MDNQLVLAIVGVIVVICFILGFWWLSQRGKRVLAEDQARLARSRTAQAKVLQIGKSVTQEGNSTVVVKLRLEVMPPGAAVYGATTVWEVQQGSVSQIQPERLVAVKIDAEDTQIVYPNVGWAEFSKIYWRAWVKEKQEGRK